MIQVTTAGNVGRSELKDINGTPLLEFSVAAEVRNGREKETLWASCSLWGKRARSLHPYLLKGTKVTAVGSLAIGEYEGKAQFNVSVDEVEFMSRADNAKQPTAHDTAKKNGYVPDDLEDDVPF